MMVGRVVFTPDVLPNGNKVGLCDCPRPGCPNRPSPDQPICGWCRKRVAAADIKLIHDLTLWWRAYLEDAVDTTLYRRYMAAQRDALEAIKDVPIFPRDC